MNAREKFCTPGSTERSGLDERDKGQASPFQGS